MRFMRWCNVVVVLNARPIFAFFSKENMSVVREFGGDFVSQQHLARSNQTSMHRVENQKMISI